MIVLPKDEPWENVNGAARLDADLNIQLAQPIRESLEEARARLTRGGRGSSFAHGACSFDGSSWVARGRAGGSGRD